MPHGSLGVFFVHHLDPIPLVPVHHAKYGQRSEPLFYARCVRDLSIEQPVLSDFYLRKPSSYLKVEGAILDYPAAYLSRECFLAGGSWSISWRKHLFHRLHVSLPAYAGGYRLPAMAHLPLDGNSCTGGSS